MDTFYLFLFTTVASTEGFIIIVLLISLLLMVYGKTRESLLFTITALATALSVVIIKNLFAIQRPTASLIEVSGYAFPSGHAAGAMFLALSIGFLIQQKSKAIRYSLIITAILVAMLIGLSRIYLGVHTPVQVGAGFILGFIWALVFIILRRKFPAQGLE